MEPGATLPYHEHVRLEQSFILEGSLDDDEGSATAGNFVWRPPGSRHTAWAGREGALALGFFLTPNDFLDESADNTYDVSAGESDGTVTPHAADHDHLPPLASRFSAWSRCRGRSCSRGWRPRRSWTSRRWGCV